MSGELELPAQLALRPVESVHAQWSSYSGCQVVAHEVVVVLQAARLKQVPGGTASSSSVPTLVPVLSEQAVPAAAAAAVPVVLAALGVLQL